MNLPKPSNRPANPETSKGVTDRLINLQANIESLWNESNTIKKNRESDYNYLLELIEDIRTTLYRNGIS